MDIIGGRKLDTLRELTPIHSTNESVAPSAETTIVLYVIPTGYNFFIQSILCSGEVAAKVGFYINGEPKVGGEITLQNKESKDIFGGVTGIKCGAGDILSLTVLHTSTGNKRFEGTIAGFLEST